MEAAGTSLPSALQTYKGGPGVREAEGGPQIVETNVCGCLMAIK